MPPVQRVQHKNLAFLVLRHDGNKWFGWRHKKWVLGQQKTAFITFPCHEVTLDTFGCPVGAGSAGRFLALVIVVAFPVIGDLPVIVVAFPVIGDLPVILVAFPVICDLLIKSSGGTPAKTSTDPSPTPFDIFERISGHQKIQALTEVFLRGFPVIAIPLHCIACYWRWLCIARCLCTSLHYQHKHNLDIYLLNKINTFMILNKYNPVTNKTGLLSHSQKFSAFNSLIAKPRQTCHRSLWLILG